MKLKELQLKAFGPFTDRTLEFTSDGPGLHIIHGANEAGKSSSLRALKAFLFGFPERTSDNFIHANKQLLVGGVIEGNDGRDQTLYRRKKRIGDLIDGDGNSLDHDAFSPLMPGIGAELFASLYGIDHQALVAGGEEILAQKGEVGKALFAAGTGMTELSEVLDSLDAEALELFKARGSNQLLNQAIGRYNDLRKTVREESLLPVTWRQHYVRKGELETEYRELEEEVQAISAELQRLKRLQSVIPELAELKNLHALLSELKSVVVLGPEFGNRTKDLRSRIDELSRQHERERKRLEEVRQRQKQSIPDQTVLDNGLLIEDLYQRLARYRKDRNDRIRLEGERTAHRRDAGSLLHAIRPDLTLDDIDRLRPIHNRKRSVQGLSARYEALKESLVRAGNDYEKAVSNLELVDKDLSRCRPPVDTDTLSGLIRRVHQAGNLDEQIRDGELEIKAGADHCKVQLNQIGLWSGELQELLTQSLPLAETLRIYRDEYQGLQKKQELIDQDEVRITQELQSLKKQLQFITGDTSVATDDDLQQSRNLRQQGWNLIKRQWLDGEIIDDELEQYSSGIALHNAYESHVENADKLADQLRDEADTAAEIETLNKQIREQEQELVHNGALLDECNTRSNDFTARWHALWQESQIVPLTPTEMIAWLDDIERLRMRVETILDKQHEHDARVSIRNILKQELHRELTRLAESGAESDSIPESALGDELVPLLNRAETTLANLEAAHQAYRVLSEKKAQLDSEAAVSAREKKDAAEALDTWQREWNKALSQLKVDEAPVPDEALDLLEMLDGCLKKLDDANGFQTRIEGIERDVNQFLEDVAGVGCAVSVDLAEKDPDQAVLSLYDSLNQARQIKETADQLTEAISSGVIEIEDTAKLLAQLKEEMGLCLKEAQCEDVSDLDQVIARSEQYGTLNEKISSIISTIIRLSGTDDIEHIKAQAEREDSDELPGKIAALQRQLNDNLIPRTNDLLTLIGEEKRELKLMDGRSRAAEAADDMQQQAAEILRLTARYGTVKLASLILQKEIERYREEHQDPVLKHASILFAQLTLGSFTGLRTDIDDKSKPVLTGVRPDGSTLTVDGMSDGTCDQLYLALRLATLEFRLSSGDPVPFIVDDILVNFDDARSLAALEVLGDVSSRTQILLFTHHSRIVEQAQRLPSEIEIVIHEL